MWPVEVGPGGSGRLRAAPGGSGRGGVAGDERGRTEYGRDVCSPAVAVCRRRHVAATVPQLALLTLQKRLEGWSEPGRPARCGGGGAGRPPVACRDGSAPYRNWPQHDYTIIHNMHAVTEGEYACSLLYPATLDMLAPKTTCTIVSHCSLLLLFNMPVRCAVLMYRDTAQHRWRHTFTCLPGCRCSVPGTIYGTGQHRVTPVVDMAGMGPAHSDSGETSPWNVARWSVRPDQAARPLVTLVLLGPSTGAAGAFWCRAGFTGARYRLCGMGRYFFASIPCTDTAQENGSRPNWKNKGRLCSVCCEHRARAWSLFLQPSCCFCVVTAFLPFRYNVVLQACAAHQLV